MHNKGRFAALLLMTLLTCSVVNAYTIVMRDGRRVTIPNEFEVGPATLTYKVSSDIQITLQLAAIDVSATEKANKETSGSFLKRAKRVEQTPASVVARPTARSVVTNSDLEKFRQAREASEVAYEKRRKELGLPSVEESRQAVMAQGERTQATLEDIRTRQDESENYWRSRASDFCRRVPLAHRFWDRP